MSGKDQWSPAGTAEVPPAADGFAAAQRTDGQYQNQTQSLQRSQGTVPLDPEQVEARAKGARLRRSTSSAHWLHASCLDGSGGVRRRKMLDQGLGGFWLLGSGADACRVHEPVLQLGREQ